MSDDFDLADFLPYRLALIAERVSRRLEVEYARSHGLSLAEWRVLANLNQLGKASVRDIQLVTNLEKSRVSRAVSRLEQSGCVKKTTSTEDARLVEIAMTRKGNSTLNEIIPVAKSIEQRLLAEVTRKQMKDVTGFFELLHAALDDDPEAKPRFDKRR